jgi:hypothetical protein
MADNIMIFQLKDHREQSHVDSLYSAIQKRLPSGTKLVILPPELEYIRSEYFEKSIDDEPDAKPFGGTTFAPTSMK